MLIGHCVQFFLSVNSHGIISFANDKNLGMSKFKSFADDKCDLAEVVGFVFERAENIVRKGENACNQHLILFT